MKKVNLLSVLLLSFSTMLVAQQKFDLKNKFAKGDKYLVDYKMTQVIYQTVGADKLKTDQQFGSLYAYEVIDLDDQGRVHLQYTYQQTAIAIKSANASMGVDYNSKRDGTVDVPPAALGMAALVGQSFTVILDKDLQVIEIRGMDKLIDLMLKKMMAALPQAHHQQMTAQFKKSFGNQSMKSTMQLVFDVYPRQPVAVNETWKSTMQLNTMYAMNLDNVYTLKKVEGKQATVTITSAIKTVQDGNPVQVRGMTIVPDLAGTQTGEAVIDLHSGLLVRSTVKQLVEGNIAIGSMSIPASIDTTVQIDSKKL